MSLEGIGAGEYGRNIVLTCRDEDGNDIDVSSYTAITVKFKSSKAKLSKTATFQSDGIDGKIMFSFGEGEMDIDGDWKGQIYLGKTGELTKSEIFKMKVEESVT